MEMCLAEQPGLDFPLIVFQISCCLAWCGGEEC